MTKPSTAISRRRVLIVSPHFPPVNAPDMQRVRQSLPYFREFGWDAHVLAVEPDATAQALEPLLLETLPPDVPVTRVKALPLGATAWAGLRNLGWRSAFSLARAGQRLLATGAFDLVYFSTTQFACLPLGRRWLQKHGVPFVIDLQDPWVNDYYERNPRAPRPGGIKFQFARATAALSESRTLAACAGVITVSPAYATTLRARYPLLAQKPIETIPFGVDLHDFAFADRLAAPSRFFTPKPDQLHVVNVGRGGADLSCALHAVLTSIKRLRSSGRGSADIHMHLIGTSYAAPAEARPQFADAIAKTDAATFCFEHPARIGHFDALRVQREADALLVLGSADPTYSPSKLYTALGAGKPVLAVAWRDSEFARQIARLQGLQTLELERDGTASEAALAVAEAFWRSLGTERGPGAPLPPEMQSRFLTGRQTAFFERVLNQPTPSPRDGQI